MFLGAIKQTEFIFRYHSTWEAGIILWRQQKGGFHSVQLASTDNFLPHVAECFIVCRMMFWVSRMWYCWCYWFGRFQKWLPSTDMWVFSDEGFVWRLLAMGEWMLIPWCVNFCQHKWIDPRLHLPRGMDIFSSVKRKHVLQVASLFVVSSRHPMCMLQSVLWKSLSRVWLFATPWTIQSREFSRPEYWSG